MQHAQRENSYRLNIGEVKTIPRKDGTGPRSGSRCPRDGRGQGKGRASGQGAGKKKKRQLLKNLKMYSKMQQGL